MLVWFLRGGDGPSWPGSRTVDHLRTSRVSRMLRRMGLHATSLHLAGIRLRWWYLRAAPDVVILDDGVGGRVLARPPDCVIVRENYEQPEGLHEDRWSGAIRAVIAVGGRTAQILPPDVVIMDEPQRPDPSVASAVAFLGNSFGVGAGSRLVVVDQSVDAPGLDAVLVGLGSLGGPPLTVIVVDPDAELGSQERLRLLPGALRIHLRPHVPGAVRRIADLVISDRPVDDLVDLLASGVKVVGDIPDGVVGPGVAQISQMMVEIEAGRCDMLERLLDDRRSVLGREAPAVGVSELRTLMRSGR